LKKVVYGWKIFYEINESPLFSKAFLLIEDIKKKPVMRPYFGGVACVRDALLK